MFDQEEFNNAMLALAQRFQPPQVEENVVFSDAALRDFCIDIGDIINGT